MQINDFYNLCFLSLSPDLAVTDQFALLYNFVMKENLEPK